MKLIDVMRETKYYDKIQPSESDITFRSGNTEHDLAKRAETHLGNMMSHWRVSQAVTARQTSLMVSMLRVSFSVSTFRPTLKKRNTRRVSRWSRKQSFSLSVNVTLLLEP